MNSQGITSWVLENILPLILLGVGLLIIVGAKKGKFSEVASTITIMVIGLVVILGAAGFRALGSDLAGVIFN